MPGQNIPNTNQKTVRAYMRVKSFVSPENPTPEDVVKFDQEVVDFLATVDNTKRFLNGRNSYSLGNRLYILVWYLESIPDEPVTQPFGGAATPVEIKPEAPVVEKEEEKKDEPDNSTKKA
jgi:hypothetical protein